MQPLNVDHSVRAAHSEDGRRVAHIEPGGALRPWLDLTAVRPRPLEQARLVTAFSPLAETRALVGRWRRDGFTTVDLEVAHLLAGLIEGARKLSSDPALLSRALALHPIAVVLRAGVDREQVRQAVWAVGPGRVRLIDGPLADPVSSTRVRGLLYEGREPGPLVGPATRATIERLGLYRPGPSERRPGKSTPGQAPGPMPGN